MQRLIWFLILYAALVLGGVWAFGQQPRHAQGDWVDRQMDVMHGLEDSAFMLGYVEQKMGVSLHDGEAKMNRGRCERSRTGAFCSATRRPTPA